MNSLQSFASFASNFIPLPVTTPESHPPRDSLSSSDDDDDDDDEIIQQPDTYDKHYIQVDSSKAVLLSMAIELTNAEFELNFDPENDEFWKNRNCGKPSSPRSPYY